MSERDKSWHPHPDVLRSGRRGEELGSQSSGPALEAFGNTSLLTGPAVISAVSRFGFAPRSGVYWEFGKP